MATSSSWMISSGAVAIRQFRRIADYRAKTPVLSRILSQMSRGEYIVPSSRLIRTLRSNTYTTFQSGELGCLARRKDQAISDASVPAVPGKPASELAVPEKPASEPAVPEKPQRPVSPDWQRDCRRFGTWLAGTSFIAGLAWLTGAHALVPLSDGKIIHVSYIGWPFWLMVIGIIIGIYVYLSASNERLPIPTRRQAEIDHSFRYSLLFVSPGLRWEFYDDAVNPLGARMGIKLGNGFTKPIQVYLEHLDVTINGVRAEPYNGAVRTLRIMPNQVREFRAPVVRGFPQGYFNGLVDYSVLYGPLDGSAIYRHRHKFECEVTGVRVTAADIRRTNPGASDWTDIIAEVDSDMPEGYEYTDAQSGLLLT
jgi:hypothetical protein